MSDPQPKRGIAADLRARIRSMERETKRVRRSQRPQRIPHRLTSDNRAVPVREDDR